MTCKYCYNKGYASVMKVIVGHPDFLGDKGFSKTEIVKIPCRKCDNFHRKGFVDKSEERSLIDWHCLP